jgi:hypothetical protein
MGQNQSVEHVKPSATTSSDSVDNGSADDDEPLYPSPTGHEYDAIDRIQAELPAIIDEESQQQVDDYMEACNKGKGPMAACYATGEFLSMFERKASFVQYIM